MEEVNSTMMYYKNFCKCHNVPPVHLHQFFKLCEYINKPKLSIEQTIQLKVLVVSWALEGYNLVTNTFLAHQYQKQLLVQTFGWMIQGRNECWQSWVCLCLCFLWCYKHFKVNLVLKTVFLRLITLRNLPFLVLFWNFWFSVVSIWKNIMLIL
jgi:hypothetical protein